MDEELEDAHRIRIFYAWQDILPKKFNRFAIQRALRIATADLEAEISNKDNEPFKIEVDEATMRVPGSPNIPAEILRKIDTADVFVADVSCINFGQVDESKKTPNPNVVFELGYAVAILGWQRVILLVNEVHGPVSTLPFDFDRHRASPFRLAEKIGSEKELITLLLEAVKLIIDKNPARPNAFDLVRTKKGRDLAALRLFLSAIHWPTLDEHISAGPKFLSLASTLFYEKANELARSSTFHLYDSDLNAAVAKLIQAWADSMKFDRYVPMLHKDSFVFKSGEHPGEFSKSQDEFKYMEKARRRMREAIEVLLKVIREKFPEIDIQEASLAAGTAFADEMARIDKRFDDLRNVDKRRRAATNIKRRPKRG